jgi:hypothetical protein
MIPSIRGSERCVAGFKSEWWPASDRNRGPASFWNAWPASSESAHGVHPNQIYGWKKQAVENLASLFARGASAPGESEEAREREASQLYAKIAQLTVERDFLAKRSNR